MDCLKDKYSIIKHGVSRNLSSTVARQGVFALTMQSFLSSESLPQIFRDLHGLCKWSNRTINTEHISYSGMSAIKPVELNRIGYVFSIGKLLKQRFCSTRTFHCVNKSPEPD